MPCLVPWFLVHGCFCFLLGVIVVDFRSVDQPCLPVFWIWPGFVDINFGWWKIKDWLCVGSWKAIYVSGPKRGLLLEDDVPVNRTRNIADKVLLCVVLRCCFRSLPSKREKREQARGHKHSIHWKYCIMNLCNSWSVIGWFHTTCHCIL